MFWTPALSHFISCTRPSSPRGSLPLPSRISCLWTGNSLNTPSHSPFTAQILSRFSSNVRSVWDLPECSQAKRVPSYLCASFPLQLLSHGTVIYLPVCLPSHKRPHDLPVTYSYMFPQLTRSKEFSEHLLSDSFVMCIFITKAND